MVIKNLIIIFNNMFNVMRFYVLRIRLIEYYKTMFVLDSSLYLVSLKNLSLFNYMLNNE